MAATESGRSGSVALAAIWVAVVIAMSAYSIWTTWPVTYSYDLPDDLKNYFYVSIAVSVVVILWSIALLGQALLGSPKFPRHFIVWQSTLIVWLLAQEIYFVLMPGFVITLRPLVTALAELAIAGFLIALMRRAAATTAGAAAPMAAGAGSEPGPAVASLASSASTPGAAPTALAAVLFGLLGLIVGAAVGFGVGLGLGIGISELVQMSCFEGACGFFAFFMGLGGGLIGAVIGAVVVVRRTLRRARPAAA